MTPYEHLAHATAAARAQLLTAPLITDCLAGRATRASYLAFLSQAYHHVRHTAPLLMRLGGKLPAHQAWLRPAVAEYISEEIGHELWITHWRTGRGGRGDPLSVPPSPPYAGCSRGANTTAIEGLPQDD
jgi:long-chain acyl-CoA synthetase